MTRSHYSNDHRSFLDFSWMILRSQCDVHCHIWSKIIEQIILHRLICRRLIGPVTNSRYQAIDRNVERKSSCLDVVKPRSV